MSEKLQAMLAGEVRPRDPNNQQSIAPRPRRAARAFMGLYLPLLRSSAGFLPCSPIFFSFGSAGGQPLPKVCPDTSSKPSEGLAGPSRYFSGRRRRDGIREADFLVLCGRVFRTFRYGHRLPIRLQCVGARQARYQAKGELFYVRRLTRRTAGPSLRRSTVAKTTNCGLSAICSSSISRLTT